MVLLVQSADHITGLAGASLTITASKNGAAFASISPTVVDRSSGWYDLALTSSHTDTLGDLALHITAGSADAIDLTMEVVSYNSQDGVRLGLTSLANAAAGAPSGLLVSGSGNNAIEVSRLYNFLRGQASSASALQVAAGSTTTSINTIGTGVATGAYNGHYLAVAFTSQLGQIITRRISTYTDNGATQTFVLDSALPWTPVSVTDNVYVISHHDVAVLATAPALTTAQASLTAINADTDNLQTRLPAALVGGRIDASVGAMAADTMTAAAAAADLTTELQAGLATAASIAALPSAAGIADAVWDEAMSGHLTPETAGWLLSITQAIASKDRVRFDTFVYDANGGMTSCRLRVFPTAADALAQTNVLRTVTITATMSAVPGLEQSPTAMLGQGA